jgi:hypothetical protein
MTGGEPKRDWSAPMFTAEQIAAEAQEQHRGRRRVLARTGAAAAAAVVAVAGVGVWAGEQAGHPTPARAATTTSASTAPPVTRFITSVSLAPPIVRTVPSTVLVTITKAAINRVTVTVTAKTQPSSAHVAPAATRKANPIPALTTRRAYPTPAPAAAATPTQTASAPTRATR